MVICAEVFVAIFFLDSQYNCSVLRKLSLCVTFNAFFNNIDAFIKRKKGLCVRSVFHLWKNGDVIDEGL